MTFTNREGTVRDEDRDLDGMERQGDQWADLVPRTPQEAYRLEKMKRDLPVQEYRNDGKRSRRHDPRPTRLACLACGSDAIVRGKLLCRTDENHRRRVRCAECGHSWVSWSKESVGGFRNVEVRG